MRILLGLFTPGSAKTDIGWGWGKNLNINLIASFVKNICAKNY